LGFLLDNYYQHSKSNRESVGERIDTAFTKRFGDCASVHLFRGQRAVTRAWDARGSEYDDDVSKEGREGFERELSNAEQELKKAWEIDSTDPAIAEEMITVCMGKGHSREEMEKWFQRALATGRDGYPSCAAKVYYLAARWHGSLAEQLEFAKECLTHPEWGDRTALILWRTHASHQKINKLPLSYFTQPAVWSDIKESFTAYFKSVPFAEALHIRYAYHAWLARDWPLLNEQLALGDPVFCDLSQIGGKKVFDQMVADAKLHKANSGETAEGDAPGATKSSN
jgi:hypothetical protein